MLDRRNLIVLFAICLCMVLSPRPSLAARPRPNQSVMAELIKSYGPSYVVEPVVTQSRPSPEAYASLRNMFFRYEESKALGSDLQLNERELQANQIIMATKMQEYNEGLITPHLFKPSQHFFKVLENIKATDLFRYMSAMPKGAVLHAHDTAIGSTEYLIKLTYRDNLWVCQNVGGLEAESLVFSKNQPAQSSDSDCTWSLMSDVRTKYGGNAVDEYLAERLTLFPTTKFDDNNAAWQQFMTIFSLVNGLLFYAPVWADYYYNALEEFLADNVQYVEFRTTLPVLYDLEDTQYTEVDTVRIYVETLKKFKDAHSDFIGSRMIYAPLRNTNGSVVSDYIKTLLTITELYPDFVAGFDLVGQEELGRPLKEFISELLAVPESIDFYFHAGETNWYGSSVDENLIDAVLLGTKRIGHGFALVKHPFVLEMLKKLNVAIEVNPISNQVLQLVTDFRNHPCSHFFADGYPVVISSDDPSFWKATPLSHDFYIAFLGIASAHSDLRLLKKLALNSIRYSSLTVDQQYDALSKWQPKWDAFIEYVITGTQRSAAPSLKLA
ncbi:adenosine deaminase 2-A [Scaptodrosophila lebanonensis]|uniref:Adenosine deaminase n=1 Tax=Drosophila lebanonensis TaxID=7225 RepID=A0A6J2UCY9_DROLE|nr:adenosine deaminase 2-A [Scaptodrosophila lebanonensis]